MPDKQEDDFLVFVGTIVDKIIKADKFQVYLDCIEIMTDEKLTEEHLEVYTAEEVLERFAMGMAEVHIMAFKDFLSKVGI